MSRHEKKSSKYINPHLLSGEYHEVFGENTADDGAEVQRLSDPNWERRDYTFDKRLIYPGGEFLRVCKNAQLYMLDHFDERAAVVLPVLEDWHTTVYEAIIRQGGMDKAHQVYVGFQRDPESGAMHLSLSFYTGPRR